ncbi:MAG: hypothetical protein LBQ63_03920 [Deltaproteobacteria bacterium]|jgi:hypothetical protein|nr:hypothetical protein [Deltaproteobacteria bacterium]
MKKIWLMLSLAAMLSAVSAVAAEFGEKADTDDATAEETSLEIPLVYEDGGTEVVYAAQAGPGLAYAEGKSAEEQLREYASARGWNEGWDEAKGRYFVIGQAAFQLSDDPAYAENLMPLRETFVKRAVLEAKADVIYFVNTTMSARDQLTTPGTPVFEELNEKYNAVMKKVLAQQKALAKLLENVDAAEARALAGATYGDRLNALMEAAIKRLGGHFDAAAVDAENKKRYEAAKQRYEEAASEFGALEAEAESLKGEVQSTFSSVNDMRAAMTLTGATVIQQAESWDEDKRTYEVAVLLCWSKALENSARAALTGQLIVEDKPDAEGRSIHDWLKQQDLSVMIGPRQFVDAEGQRYFLGVTAREAVRNTALDSKNRTLADMFAAQVAVFSLFADVDAKRIAEQAMQERSGGLGDSTAVTAESLETAMSQSVQKLQVQGLGPLLRKKVTHAISGQEIHVAVYGISPKSAAAAMRLERQAALASIEVNRDQAFKQARSQELRRAVETSRNDPAAGRAGARAGRAELEAAQKQAASSSGGSAAKPAGGRSASGSFMGGSVKDDF